MNRINTTQVTDPTSQQPWTIKSVDFLQNSIQDSLNALARALIGEDYSASTVYVLNRCEKVGNVIDSGYVFYNGEVYILTGADTSAYVNIPVIISAGTIIDPTYDPVTFSDGVNKYVHDVRQLKIADQLTGTGYADYADVVFVDRNKRTILSPAGSTVGGAGVLNIVGSDYTTPSHATKIKVTISMDISVAYATDGRLGANIYIRNATSASDIFTVGAVLDNTNTSAGKTRTQRVSATVYLGSIAAAQQLFVKIQNTQADTHSFGNMQVIWEHYS